MQFNKLRLTGFKSFVDPSELTILKGLTGVVGPNGCGKSNLLEALRWVMGENRASAMRGDGMEDVIFAGTTSRSARNFAEVVLSIDNSDRLAPAGFNEHDTLEVSRRITRDAGSAYKANGKDVRAKDIQMLFADASTGAHSPALVRQGQIAELINAKPKNRRRILEEAAGISGLYQRRHEAELKLKAADANLLRVDDVIDQLAAQLATLARQAKQAQRYREIGEDLRAEEIKLLYRRWLTADLARVAAEQEATTARTLTAAADRALREAAAKREKDEAALPPLREEDGIAAAILQRLVIEKETLTKDQDSAQSRIRGLRNALAQLEKDTLREAGLNQDAQSSVTALREERDDLKQQSQGYDDTCAAAQGEASTAVDAVRAQEHVVRQTTETVAAQAAAHKSVQDRLTDLERNRTQMDAQTHDAQETQSQSQTAVEAARRAGEVAAAQENAAKTDVSQREAQRRGAEEAADHAVTQSAQLGREASEANSRVGALRAEVQTLEKLLMQAKSGGPSVLDKVTVQPGYEKALSAALGDDLKFDHSEDHSQSGWHGAPTPASAALGDARLLSDFVNAPEALNARLAATFVVSTRPDHLPMGTRAVTQAGDLWRWDGFALWAKDASTDTARRLELENRLKTIGADLRVEEQRRDTAAAAASQAQAQVTLTREALSASKDALRIAEQSLAEATRERARAATQEEAAQSRLETARAALDRLTQEAAIWQTRYDAVVAEQEQLSDLEALRAQAQTEQATLETLRAAMMEKNAAYEQIKREGAARQSRLERVERDIASWSERLASTELRSDDLKERIALTQSRLAAAEEVPATIAADLEKLGHKIQEAEQRRAAAADQLSFAEGALRELVQAEREATTAASGTREALARFDARFEAARDGVAEAHRRIQEAYDQTPQALAQTHDIDAHNLPEATEIDTQVQKFRRQRDALGAVNLRAEEDAKEVQIEHDTLLLEKTELEEAIATLRSGIANLNKEGRERLLTAFEQVNDNFGMLFTHLFGGGEARLVMVESDDPLDAGLEIMCQPPGKKLSTLSLLSGGEQTLTAMALIFAVFLANPAPICVLDEVDAPLDDANVTRFCDMLDEMCRRTETRFLIITHHAVTMARMDRLFGVTMHEKGVSQLVSVDLRKAEELVA